MNPIRGSVNIGSVHKSYKLAPPLGFLLFHRQQHEGGGGGWKSSTSLHMLISNIHEVTKAWALLHRSWRHSCNARPLHRPARSLNPLEALGFPRRIENITHRNFSHSLFVLPPLSTPQLLHKLSVTARSVFHVRPLYFVDTGENQ